MPKRATADQESPLPQIRRLDRRNRFLLAGVFLVVATTLDATTGTEVRLFILYYAPVALLAWFGTRWEAFLAALCGGVAWWLANVAGREFEGSEFIRVWNAGVTSASCLAIGWMLSSIRGMMNRLELAATRDALTGLGNRRVFQQQLVAEILRTRRYSRPFSLALLDLDYFKATNDKFGHEAGDRALVELGRVLRRNLRRADASFRLGGDEFAVILPETAAHEAQAALEKARRAYVAAVRELGYPTNFTAGVVECAGGRVDREALISTADEVLYATKEGGRGRVGARRLAGKARPTEAEATV